MKARERALLDETANRMIEEAQAAGSDRVFSATGFAREHISILHQQLRCTNLAWALAHTKRVKRGSAVAIVGGSFSGMMLATTLAIASDAIVYILEKESRLLHRFLDKSHRYLSPNLNSRCLGPRFDPASVAFFTPPIFDWRAGVASEVAWKWVREFEEYKRNLPVFTFCGYEITKRTIKRHAHGLTLDLRNRKTPHIQPIHVDLLIDATGFGEEDNPHNLADFSYWDAGHRLIYDHLPTPCNVLVSGCGDSGLIEAMHYAIKDFRHDLVEQLWPYRKGLEAHLDLGLEAAKLDRVLRNDEVDRYEGQVLSEICWWLDIHYHREINGLALSAAGDFAPAVFGAVENLLRARFEAASAKYRFRDLSWQERETFALRLPLKFQLHVREEVRPIVDSWISRRMAKLANEIPIGKLLRAKDLYAKARPGVTVTLNARTPTPYTQQLSIYNVWLMRVLMSFPNVRYRQGKVLSVDPDVRGRSKVAFDKGPRQVFDRVVTRYGPASSKGVLARRRSRDPHAGSWLLSHVDPAVQHVAERLRMVDRRHAVPRARELNKTLYVGRLLFGERITLSDEIYRNPQEPLSAMLRTGRRLRYVDCRGVRKSR